MKTMATNHTNNEEKVKGSLSKIEIKSEVIKKNIKKIGQRMSRLDMDILFKKEELNRLSHDKYLLIKSLRELHGVTEEDLTNDE